MSREAHVRFSEGAGARFPRATRLLGACETVSKTKLDCSGGRLLQWLAAAFEP